jgi:hypothetical protein
MINGAIARRRHRDYARYIAAVNGGLQPLVDLRQRAHRISPEF